MRLTIVRHGETEDNKSKTVQGHRPSPLTEQGRNDAIQVGKRLADLKFHAIYASDLHRVKQTVSLMGKDAEFRPEWRERSFGVYEGMPMHEYKPIAGEDIVFRPEKGESRKDTQERVVAAYKELKEKHNGEDVLLVAHGGVVKALLVWLHNEELNEANYQKYHPGNGSVTIIEDDELVLFDCRKHLD